jgi:hypothetical protein
MHAGVNGSTNINKQPKMETNDRVMIYPNILAVVKSSDTASDKYIEKKSHLTRCNARHSLEVV